MKLAIVSDEISRDVNTAVELGLSWGIRAYEIRNLYNGRVPNVEELDIERVLALKEQHGLTITGISPGLFKIAADDPQVATRLAEDLPRACDLAHRLGTDAVVDFGFRKPGAGAGALGDVPGKEYPQAVVDLLGRVAEAMAGHGCRFLLENEHICWADTGQATAAIVREVNHDNLRVNWDPTNAAHFGEAVFPDGYEFVKPFVAHVHVKDYVVDEDGFRVVVPGQGQVGWAEQLRALIADGYAGWVVVETHMTDKVENSRRCVAAVKDMLVDLCGEVG